MVTVSLTVSTSPDDGGDLVTATLDDDDVSRLRRFIAAMGRIRASRLVSRGIPEITRIQGNATGPHFTCGPYEDSELHELLHVLRPVILTKEFASFERVAGIVKRRFVNPLLRRRLKTLHSLFADGELKQLMQISLGGVPLFHGNTLNLWLNGEQYHQDDEKAEAWRTLANALAEQDMRAYVVTQVASKVRALRQLEYIVELVLQKIDGGASERTD